MSAPYLGEIRMISFGTPPMGWALCDGSTLPYVGNQLLYSLIGITYGGTYPTPGQNPTGVVLPDLRGRTPLAAGQRDRGGTNYTVGNSGGAETTQAPNHGHRHALMATADAATLPNPEGRVYADVAGTTATFYDNPAPFTLGLQNGPIQPAGGGQPWNSMQPFGVVQFMICTGGVYPPRH